MSGSSPIVLFTGIQRLARSLRSRGFTAACLREPGEFISSPEDVDIWIPYDPKDLAALESWVRDWDLRDRVVAVINRREKRVVEHAFLNQALGKVGVKPNQARIFRDKFRLREALAVKAPHLNPPYADVDITLSSMPELPFPVLLKPRNLFKSQLITLCRAPENWAELRSDIGNRLGPAAERHGVQIDTSFVAEAYIQGKEISVDAFVTAVRKVICTPVVELTPARQWDMEDFHVAVRHLPAILTPGERERALNAVEEVSEALELSATPLHVDMVLLNDETMILDVAPRVGGYRSEMMDLAYGRPLDILNLELALHDRPLWQAQWSRAVAVIEIFPSHSGQLSGVRGLKRIRALPSFHRARHRIPPGEAVGWARDGFRCPIFVVLAHPNAAQVRNDVEQVRRHLYLEVGTQ
jgi:hypothetical protein